MRHAPALPPAIDNAPAASDRAVLSRLLPYLWDYKWRVAAALCCVVLAKGANLGVPILLKKLVDSLSISPSSPQALLVVPIGLIVAYGLLRLSTSLFTELREIIFAKATQGASRRIALEVFSHLHGLSLQFHLSRQTGGLTRDIERGTRAVQSLISFSLYNIIPTLIEVILVLGFLAWQFDVSFAVITLVALSLYVAYTVMVTQWRTEFRKKMNELDSQAQSKAIDSLLNYETVKYFNNETFEEQRYAKQLQNYQKAALQNQWGLSLLNSGQQLIIGMALIVMLWQATKGVVAGDLTVGDLVMVNAFMIQIYIPLNFLGMAYREIKQGLTDLSKMFALLSTHQDVADAPNAQPLRIVGTPDAPHSPTVELRNVHFSYDAPRPTTSTAQDQPDTTSAQRAVLHGVSITIPAGKTVAVVGPSGSGKSTLARLLYRFYDVQSGQVLIDGQNVKDITQSSLRRQIGIVPQDTVLFNDTVAYNIAYGKPDATQEEIEQAARAAHIHDFIMATPKGYATQVGERGLKLSGGEKQRVAIARTLLKNPPILIFDEATSALDSGNERAIQAELTQVAQGKTTLVIAHRLSTVVDAHQIIVLEHGHVVEQGRHDELLAKGDSGHYARMWALQQRGEA